MGLLLALSADRSAAAPVSCANPDNLCVGNPCVTGQLEVISPCVVDFGDRTLVIRGAVKVPNGGVLSLKARNIDVRRPIIGRHSRRVGGLGASVTLTASDDITVRWRIDVSSRLTPGSIHLVAGRNVQLLAPIRAATAGPQAQSSGGSVVVEAGGIINAVRRARIRVRGAATPGGSAMLSGRAGVRMQNSITANGSEGGHVVVRSETGDVVVVEGIDISGLSGKGGSAMISARDGDVTLFERVDAEGMVGGGEIAVHGGGSAIAFGSLRAGSSALGGNGGVIMVSASSDVLITDVLSANGADGGQIFVSSVTGTTRLNAPLTLAGRDAGGTLKLTGVNAIIRNQIDADGDASGGTIMIDVGDMVTVTPQGALLARGEIGGSIMVDANAISVLSGARVLVDGDTPAGSISLAARNGDLLLDGDFRARGDTGGQIEASATGNVVAGGDFAARGDGCISLSAGSTLDVTGASFDVPLAAACP